MCEKKENEEKSKTKGEKDMSGITVGPQEIR